MRMVQRSRCKVKQRLHHVQVVGSVSGDFVACKGSYLTHHSGVCMHCLWQLLCWQIEYFERFSGQRKITEKGSEAVDLFELIRW